MKISAFILVAFTMAFCGCTNVSVRPLLVEDRIQKVVIQENSTAEDSKFLAILVAGFKRHGIATEVVSDATNVKDAYVVTYVAYSTWDFGRYLSDAAIIITKDGRKVAQALYHLKGGGGFAPAKWDNAQSKIDPLIDELLKDYPQTQKSD